MSRSTHRNTQHQQSDYEVDQHLWGYLTPLGSNPNLLRIDFWRISPTAKLGRDPSKNTLILPGPHISAAHATITWNGRNGAASEITLTDSSSGGTWVAGQQVEKGKSHRLKDGDEIGFGAPVAIEEDDGLYDHRFIFSDVSTNHHINRLDDLYVYGKYLGAGTGGCVRLATEKKTNKAVAIKTMHYLATRMNVFGEISVMERVLHPHILRMSSVHHAETQPIIYLVLEYMPGGDLLNYMIKEFDTRTLWPNGPDPRGIPEHICREIMYQLCHAMAFLHAQGITHRDLKPENILLLDKNMEAPFIKVADFGLASLKDEMKNFCGTVIYAAPEVLDAAPRRYNYLADSFSTGIILFSMLILMDPWRSKRTMECLSPGLRWNLLETYLLSPAGFDLLDHLVNPNPQERLSLAGALKHLWLKAHQPMHHTLTFPL
ncbi:kinase-like domain-containing protein [Favolaschia claudopus]|uniref:Kinase-like domain-containing protein n=1 Tax=Favolaschia claudopus TaxID=2862362 RepID=A0AAW0BZF7_9AGAR